VACFLGGVGGEGEKAFNETQILEVIELILLEKPNKCVHLKGN
jgi:hypothetical protein